MKQVSSNLSIDFYGKTDYDRNSSDSSDYCETCNHNTNSRDFHEIRSNSKIFVFNRAKLSKIGLLYFKFLLQIR